MSDKITKKEVLSGIATCAEMENHFFNGSTPDASYKEHIKKIRLILERLLELKCPK